MISFYKGDTHVLAITPVEFSRRFDDMILFIRSTLKPQIYITKSLSATNGGITYNEIEGKYYIHIDPSDTANMNCKLDYECHIKVIIDSEVVTTHTERFILKDTPLISEVTV